VVHVDRFCDARSLVEVLQVAPQDRVVHDTPQVAFEVAVVDGVEAYERWKEAPVGLCFLRAGAGVKVSLNAANVSRERADRLKC
jgi:hypothetical protein